MKKTTKAKEIKKVPVSKSMQRRKQAMQEITKEQVDEAKKTIKSTQTSDESTQKGAYTVTLDVNGASFRSSADEVKDALLGFKIAPADVKTTAYFMLSFEGKQTNKVLSVIARTRRILSNEMTAFFFGRRLISILKGVPEPVE